MAPIFTGNMRDASLIITADCARNDHSRVPRQTSDNP